MISRRRIKILLASLVLLFFIIIFSRHALREQALGVIRRPFVSLGQILGQQVRPAATSYNLQEENKAIDQALLQSLKKENDELKLLLGYKEATENRLVTARIIAHLKDPFVNVVRIDRGRTDGLNSGDPVIAGEGILLGRVSSVYEHSADVLLALDPRSKLEAKVLGREGATGVLEGQGIVYRLRFIPRESGVNRDDLVITTIPVSPKPLVIGMVRGIESDAETPFDTLVIEPMRDPLTISFVRVLVR